jgi:hypothetical protein
LIDVVIFQHPMIAHRFAAAAAAVSAVSAAAPPWRALHVQLGVANKKATQVLFYSRKNFLLHPINLWDATESFSDM